MEQKKDFRWLRVTGASLLGIVLLMMLIPSTGCITDDPALNPKMMRCGPFLFYSDFFWVVGIITALTACTVFGIIRRNRFEAVGWVLFGLVVFAMFLT